jgi:hypothetical protein
VRSDSFHGQNVHSLAGFSCKQALHALNPLPLIEVRLYYHTVSYSRRVWMTRLDVRTSLAVEVEEVLVGVFISKSHCVQRWVTCLSHDIEARL